jgi:hypothetical protein
LDIRCPVHPAADLFPLMGKDELRELADDIKTRGLTSPERHSTDDWRGRAYCRTREALIRCSGAYCGEIDPPLAAAALQMLPERIDEVRA